MAIGASDLSGVDRPENGDIVAMMQDARAIRPVALLDRCPPNPL
jgi:hypothetical protein